ncbi:MAG: sterol carrier family protein [Propionicimonas sp.]|uniref:sterol carrier family protein n=1 Tax=Propionicimonas sp. TaxID=1955623 RepID=UPI002B1ED995|nr:sterol carrier family protein [Propionicimonas sp.]MEA4944275.1 sterol carrier family protein [Propionicimonas sp.]MEA5051841.1 sterol carrier family protein [Propionicimonas sp.]
MPKRVTTAELAALTTTLREVAAGNPPTGAALVAAVRVLCRTLGERHPGGTLEVRVPPYAAVQLGIGQRGAHTRGTPPNVVETDPATILQLAAGSLSWAVALERHAVSASGAHADLSGVLPLAR